MAENTYTLGKGEVHFARYKTGTKTPGGERYLGNTPSFSLNISEDRLDHYSSDRGVKEKDASISLQTNRSGTLECDNIDPENLALFFFGSKAVLTQASATALADSIVGVELDRSYQIGTSALRPAGVRKVANVVVKKGSTTFVADTDYVLDADLGRITIPASGTTIVVGDTLEITYDLQACSVTQIVSGATSIEGAMRFIAYNPQGEQMDYFMPYVRMSPNGDFALKGDEFLKLSFNVEVLKKTGLEAIYVNGRPYTA